MTGRVNDNIARLRQAKSVRFTTLGKIVAASALLTTLVSALPVVADNRLSENGHWDRDGHALYSGHMDIVDDTGSSWPVYNSITNDWTRADHINVGYSSSASSCGHHCVRAETLTNSQEPAFTQNCSTGGFAYVKDSFVGGGNHFTEAVHIEYNRHCGDAVSDFRRKIITCQEIGHVLGLRHRPSEVADCMYPYYAVATSGESTAHDRQIMIDQTIYDH